MYFLSSSHNDSLFGRYQSYFVCLSGRLLCISCRRSMRRVSGRWGMLGWYFRTHSIAWILENQFGILREMYSLQCLRRGSRQFVCKWIWVYIYLVTDCSPRELIYFLRCADGYTGARCGQCDVPHFFRLGDYCRSCPSQPTWWLVLTVSLPILLVFFLLQSVSSNFKSGSLAIGFDFIQGKSFIGQYSILSLYLMYYFSSCYPA